MVVYRDYSNIKANQRNYLCYACDIVMGLDGSVSNRSDRNTKVIPSVNSLF